MLLRRFYADGCRVTLLTLRFATPYSDAFRHISMADAATPIALLPRFRCAAFRRHVRY